jgi:hypothetical protein
MGNNCPCVNKFVSNKEYNLSHNNTQQAEKEDDIDDTNNFNIDNENFKNTETPIKNTKTNFNENIYNNNSSRNTNQDSTHLNNINININNINRIINNYQTKSDKKNDMLINPLQIDFSNEKKISNINKINKITRGYLLRKKYNKTLKAQLIKHGNDLYNEYIKLTKNKKVTEILESKDPNILSYMNCSWTEFYSSDPTKEIQSQISSIKKYLSVYHYSLFTISILTFSVNKTGHNYTKWCNAGSA